MSISIFLTQAMHKYKHASASLRHTQNHRLKLFGCQLGIILSIVLMIGNGIHKKIHKGNFLYEYRAKTFSLSSSPILLLFSFHLVRREEKQGETVDEGQRWNVKCILLEL